MENYSERPEYVLCIGGGRLSRRSMELWARKATEDPEINGLFENWEDKAASSKKDEGHAYETSERSKYYKDYLCDILS